MKQQLLKTVALTCMFSTQSFAAAGIGVDAINTAARVMRRVVESSALSQAPRILTCHKVKRSALDRCFSAERVTVPTYAPELTQWVLDRRLSQLSAGIDRNLFKDILKERFDYQDVWLSTTSNAVFDYEDYRVVINHTNVDTSRRYCSGFDVFLRDTPQKLWIEGRMRVSELRFEGGAVRDAHDLSYFFQVLTNNVFPNGLLESHFSEKKNSKAKETPELKKLVEGVLDEGILNKRLFWGIDFIPFINSALSIDVYTSE